jgi:hypothetical protein
MGHNERGIDRRRFIQLGVLAGAAIAGHAETADRKYNAPPPGATYDTQVSGIRIVPGSWRPHYRWEHIAWVSPSWPSQDYMWLDFPEAIFTSAGLIFLSHINPGVPSMYNDLPRVEWNSLENGIAFERTVPNNISFGGSVTKASETVVALELSIKNGLAEPLKNITLQTCNFLRAIHEFADYTSDNKFVHIPEKGWTKFAEAAKMANTGQPYRVGWRGSGKAVSDVPMMVTTSNKTQRLVAMTWLGDTLSMVGNPGHPCMHADPKFKDLEPGETQTIHGKLVFFEDALSDFKYQEHL